MMSACDNSYIMNKRDDECKALDLTIYVGTYVAVQHRHTVLWDKMLENSYKIVFVCKIV